MSKKCNNKPRYYDKGIDKHILTNKTKNTAKSSRSIFLNETFDTLKTNMIYKHFGNNVIVFINNKTTSEPEVKFEAI